MKILPVVSVLFICVSQLTAPLLAQERPPIIDMHMHADLPPYDVPAGAPAPCRPEPCRGEGQATANHAQTLEKTLEAMERYNIVKGFLSGIDLEIVQEWVAAAPGRFIAAPFILQVGRPDAEILRREYAAGRLSGMGEIATQLDGVAPNDRRSSPTSRWPKSSTYRFSFTRRGSALTYPASVRSRAIRCFSRRCWSTTRSSGSTWRIPGSLISAR